MKWINALGLILQFVAFWFAAPELLGETTLRRFEAGLRKFISSLPVIIFTTVALCYGLYFGIGGTMRGFRAQEKDYADQDFYSFLTIMAVATILYLVMVFRYKKILNWLDIKYAQPLTERLINSNQTRKNALIVGAIIFTIGFLMQLGVILLG